jgi:hydroxymethylbilane synthase
MTLRLGTRASPLARWQAQWVATRLQQCGFPVELVLITTSGDRDPRPLRGGPERGVFTKELQRALLWGRIDLAVHSLKDLPTEEVSGVFLAAVPERGPVADVLLSPGYPDLASLPRGARVGTGSQRRRAQLLHLRPDLQVQEVRGNVDTRLRKLEAGEFDALVLAEAGLRRLGLEAHITQVFPPALILPAIGQGALGIEVRAEDHRVKEAVRCLDHPATHRAVLAERAMLATLHGGCLAPIAGWGRSEGAELLLTGRVCSPDGAELLESTAAVPQGGAEPAIALGNQVAQDLLAKGAARLIQAARA